MSSLVILTYYCLLVLAASLVGGMIPLWVRLTHRRMQVAISFVAAMMLGVGMLHMLPHALDEARRAELPSSPAASTDYSVLSWMIAGWLAMFFIERFFCFHHHDVETDAAGELHEHGGDCEHRHHHDITWSGAALGLTLHSLLEGVALAASVEHSHGTLRIPGLAAFLVIFLHKPFDAMTIAMLLARGRWPIGLRYVVNACFALAIPAGMALFYVGLAGESSSTSVVASALAFSAGTFLCISLSDLLPELQFHDHDRVALSVALLLGLAVSTMVARMESLVHRHGVEPASTAAATALLD